MPYIIKPKRLCGALVAATAALALAAAPALAEEESPCEAQPFSQPFAYANDPNNYVLVPGESANAFEGNGWQLRDGARIVQATLSDGSTGPVLELPGAGKAVSPTFCVTSEYPTARAMIGVVDGPGLGDPGPAGP